MSEDKYIVEGVVYDPVLDSHARAVLTDNGEYVYVEELLSEGDRVRVTIEILEEA